MRKRNKFNMAGGPQMINFKDMSKRTTKFNEEKMHHMVYLNHLSANRNVKKKGVKDTGNFSCLI